MEGEYETLELEIRRYISPECACKVEDMVNAVPHVIDSTFDPVNNILNVRVHKGMVSAKDVIEALKRCAVECETRTSAHEKAHMEHEGMKMKQPMAHDHHAMMEAEMQRHFLVSAVFTVPVLILSPSIQRWAGYTLPSSPVWDVLLAALASVVILYGGLVFYKGSVQALRLRTLDMNVLVSIALLLGYVYSLGATFVFEAPDFYWEISTLASFILFGHWMEMKAARRATGALKELVKLIPPSANLVNGSEVVEVATSELKVGDVVLVKPGEKIPIDGEVVDGDTSVNEAMITGESKPVGKSVGSEVIGLVPSSRRLLSLGTI